jgi:hypothetical protein
MPFRILQKRACAKACANCPNAARERCDGHSACKGYGTTENCPPLIVLAVVECAAAALAAARLPAFGSYCSA